MSRRVLLVSPYALGEFGGVQEQVLAMSRELARRGDDVMIIAPDARDARALDTPARVVRLGRRLSMPANGSRAPLTLSPVAASRARRVARDFTPDVTHLHEPFAPLVGWGILRAHRAPAVGTFHRAGSGPALSLTGPLLRVLARGLDVAAAVSEAAAATVRDAAGVRATTLFNALETERFVATPRSREATPLLVSVGRLEERKGVRVVIEAVRRHNARTAGQWRLVVAGDGPQRGALERLAGGDAAISFVGAIDDAAKRDLLRRGDVFVAPALFGESFGLVLLEAMASEIAVVASDLAGYRQAAGEHAAFAPPGDAAALEERIAQTLAGAGEARVEAARRHAEAWSMRRLVDAYEVLYDAARERFAATR